VGAGRGSASGHYDGADVGGLEHAEMRVLEGPQAHLSHVRIYGNTRLYFNIRDIETNKSILLQSTRGTFTIKRDLVNYIESNPDMAYRVN